MTEYYKMPPMHIYEPYDRCLDEFPQHEASYCLVNILIEPNNSNPIWHIIKVCLNIVTYLLKGK